MITPQVVEEHRQHGAIRMSSGHRRRGIKIFLQIKLAGAASPKRRRSHRKFQQCGFLFSLFLSIILCNEFFFFLSLWRERKREGLSSARGSLVHTFGRGGVFFVVVVVLKRKEKTTQWVGNKTNTSQRICAHDFNANVVLAHLRE